MKIVAVRQLVSGEMWGLVMVLVGHGSNNRVKVWADHKLESFAWSLELSEANWEFKSSQV